MELNQSPCIFSGFAHIDHCCETVPEDYTQSRLEQSYTLDNSICTRTRVFFKGHFVKKMCTPPRNWGVPRKIISTIQKEGPKNKFAVVT